MCTYIYTHSHCQYIFNMPIRRKTGIAKRRYIRKRAPAVSKATKRYVKTALKTNKETNWANVYAPEVVEQSFDVPILTKLSAIAQGNTVNTREGDRLEPVSLSVNMIHATASIFNYSRFIIFQWKPDDAVEAPTQAKVLEYAGTAYSITSPLIQEAVDRKKFKVLKDFIVMNNSNTTTGAVHRQLSISKFNNKFIYYNTGATTGKGQLYMLSFANTAIATAGPTVSGHLQLRWKDTA